MPAKPASAPRTKPAEERRDDLMSAAEQLFLDKGVEPTTIEEITRGAGVAKGTFYLHFGSKADMLDALRTRLVQRLLDRIVAETARRPTEDWPGRLAAWAEACCTGYLDAARLHHLVFVAAPPPTREGLTRNPLIDDLEALLASGAAAGAWLVDDPRFTAIFLFNALHGVVNQPGIGNGRAARRALLRAVAQHFGRVVGAPGGTMRR